ncbi:unnamed protein product [Musa acuminata subsp. burmannicoides]
MGRAPCCDKAKVKKGTWSPEEDKQLKEYIERHGTGRNWIVLPQKAGLRRCGKSCRLRWLNYLRPNIKHGDFSDEEDRIICSLFASIGSRWSIIAGQLPGRTDNDIKNYWNTKLKKKLSDQPPSHRNPHHQQHYRTQSFSSNLEMAVPFPDLEGIPIHPSLFNSLTPTFFSPLCQRPAYQSGNLIMFGGNQPSCGSSDGSSIHTGYGSEHMSSENHLHEKLLPCGEASLRYEFDEASQLHACPVDAFDNLYLDSKSSATMDMSLRNMARAIYHC